MISKKNRFELIILLVIVLLGIGVRLYGINIPLVDSHQIRQAQTAMMTRNLYDDGLNILQTRLDFFGNVPGYIIMEFPFMHSITAFLYGYFGVHEIIGRLVSVAFSAGAMLLMYGLARQFLSVFGSLAALALYVFSPMNIFFSRAFMPESSMMFFMVGSIYYSLKWIKDQTPKLYLIALVFAMFACLIKPTMVLIFAPILMAWFLKYNWSFIRRFDFWFYMFLALMPFMLWGTYANYFNAMQSYLPYGFGGNWLELLKSRGTISHWFSLDFYIFIGRSIIVALLTPLGFIGAVAGIFCVDGSDRRWILSAWLIAIIGYLFIFAGPNSGHVYYQLPLLPLAVIYFGFTVEWFLNKWNYGKVPFKGKLFFSLGSVFLVVTIIYYGIGAIMYITYMYGNRMPYNLEVAKVINEYAPKNSFIIIDQPGTMYAGVLEYYSHCRASYFYPSKTAVSELEDLRVKGATIYVAVNTKYGNGVKSTQENTKLWRYLNEKSRPIALNSNYLIFDLRKPKVGR